MIKARRSTGNLEFIKHILLLIIGVVINKSETSRK